MHMDNFSTKYLRMMTANGIMYKSFLYICAKIVSVVTTIILLRILTPYDYGIVAIGMILIAVFQRLETFGVNLAIIQRDNVDEVVYGTGFIIKIIIGVLFFVASFIIAPYWAAFYDEKDVSSVIRFLAIIIIISSFRFIPNIHLLRELKFKQRIIPDIVRTLVRSILTILLAVYGFKYWSLVYGEFIGTIASVITYNLISPWKIKLIFDKTIARDLISFGKWIVLSSIIFWGYNFMDNLVIGKVLGTIALGYYVISYRWGHLITEVVRSMFGEVLFSTYSKIKHDMKRLQRGIIQNAKYAGLIVFPVSFSWCVLSDDFVRIIIGEKWLPVIVPLQILLFSGLVRSLHIGGAIFSAMGKPKIETFIMGATLLVFIVTVYPSILFGGLIGASFAVVFTFTIALILQFHALHTLIGINIWSILKEWKTPFMASIMMIILLLALKYLQIHLISTVVTFLLLIVVGVLFYFLILYALTHGEILKDIKEIYRIVFRR